MKKKILQECLRIATSENIPQKHPEFGNYHHWSFVVQNNKIVEFGKNRPGANIYKNFGYFNKAKIHSEADAYRKAKGILDKNKDFEIINVRLNKSGDLRVSAPCRCCTNFLKFVGCKNVWFTTDSGFAKLIC